MDLIRIQRGTYVPDMVIENYTSLVWTERYSSFGEFEIKSASIDYMRTNIPEGSLLSLIDTDEVMIVETHSIDVNDDDVNEVTITGRTLASILESRVIGGELTVATNNPRYLLSRPAKDKAALLIFDSVVTAPVFHVAGFVRSTDELIGGTCVSDSTVSSSPPYSSAVINMGDIASAVYDILNQAKLGLRIIRPRPLKNTNSKYGFTNNYAPADQAGFGSEIPSVTLRFDIYDAQDYSLGHSGTPIVFDWNTGDVNDPKYLMSIADLKNVATLWTSWGVQYTIYPTGGGVPSDLDRRTMFIDGTSWSDIGAGSSADIQAATDRARQLLNQHILQFLFNGQIALTSPHKYKQEYDLGYLVSLRGNYGINLTMQVTEYIRTRDATGETGYPTLALLS